MKIAFYLLALLIQTHVFCQNSDNPLVGKWKMMKVIQANEDVTSEHNPADNRYIIFNADSTFQSGGDPYGINTGTYYFKSDGVLFIDSDAGEDDDSLWMVHMKNNGKKMIWTGATSIRASEFVLIHRRMKD